ncbi:MAG: hydroxyacylglutathione hydrolase [Eubacteriales bacterium]|nr:hydroxyacylglutathione hydrolase [Eubacteriales bacterium]
MGPFFITREVYCFRSRLWQVNTTVLTNQLATVVVDPAYFPDEIKEVIDFLGEQHCRAGYIILTHCDFDHVADWQKFSAPVIYAGKGYGQSDHRAQLKKMEETGGGAHTAEKKGFCDGVRRQKFFPMISPTSCCWKLSTG